MTMTLVLHRAPDFLLAVIACWLGLGLLVRAPHDRIAQAFAWFCVCLSLYGLTGLLPQLTSAAGISYGIGRWHLLATVMAPAAFLHFIMVLTRPDQLALRHWVPLGLCYAVALGMGGYALSGALPDPLMLPWSRWGELRFPAGPLSWAWAAQRVLPLLLCVALIWRSLRSEAGMVQSRTVRQIFVFTTVIGVIGALLATGARTFASIFEVSGATTLLASPAVSRTIILVAMLVLAFAVVAYRALLPARTAQRTFVYSLVGSLMTTFYVALLIVLEWAVGDWLQIDAPLVTIFALVIMVAILGPMREWMRDLLDQRFYRREFDYGRLLRALSDDLLEAGSLEEQLEAALAAICRVLRVEQGLVATCEAAGLQLRAGTGLAAEPAELRRATIPGEARLLVDGWASWPAAELLLPIRRSEETLGLLMLGRRRSNLPYGPTEQALLDHLTSYLSLAIFHARTRDNEQIRIGELAAQSAALKVQQNELARQAAVTARQVDITPVEAAEQNRLRVWALGSLRVERDGEPISRWGGNKAGTYQAEALFAFLFDRRGKGVSKDEVEELIWPDLDLSKADAAFHRTIGALRRTLEPGLRRGNDSRTILYHHERYWLEPVTISWSDVEVFRSAVEQGANAYHQADTVAAQSALERAVALYRGDYLDDCPFFGDSSYVEEQRAFLRNRYIDAQLMLAALYEEQNRVGDAVSAYRRALDASPEGCPPATAGLNRLQVGTT